MPLASSGLTTALPRLAQPPACQTHDTRMTPFSAQECAELLADRRLLPGGALLVGADQARHQADVELRRTRRPRRRSDRGSYRARLCARPKLRHRSSSATSSDRPARRSSRCVFFSSFSANMPAQPVAEITLGRGAARKLMRDLDGAGRGREPRSGKDGGARQWLQQECDAG